MADVLVLSYHAISRDWPAALAVMPDRLEAQVRRLARRGYRGATVHEAVHSPPGQKTVAFTFDDAYRSVLQLAFPILQQVGYPGTVFVPTDFPDHDGPMAWSGIDPWLGGPHESELRCMSWSELHTLADAGWEIGAHSCSHPDLTEISDAELDRELTASRELCEQQLDRRCVSMAYPFGRHDQRVVDAVRRAGYDTALTVPDVLTSHDPLRWPRIGIYREDGLLSFEAKVSRVPRNLRKHPAGKSLVQFVRAVRAGVTARARSRT